jgi:hypothetical protein
LALTRNSWPSCAIRPTTASTTGSPRRPPTEVDGHAVALAGPDPGADLVEREALLVVVRDHGVQFGPADPGVVRGERVRQRGHVDPAAIGQFDADLFRRVPKVDDSFVNIRTVLSSCTTHRTSDRPPRRNGDSRLSSPD